MIKIFKNDTKTVLEVKLHFFNTYIACSVVLLIIVIFIAILASFLPELKSFEKSATLCAAIATCFGVVVGLWTLRSAEKTRKAQFLYAIYERYSSKEMLHSLRVLEGYFRKYKSNTKSDNPLNPNLVFPFDTPRTYKNNLGMERRLSPENLNISVQWTEEEDAARRNVKNFCFLLLDYMKQGYISGDEFRRYASKSGLNFLFSVIEPMEYFLNHNYSRELFHEYMDAIQDPKNKDNAKAQPQYDTINSECIVPSKPEVYHVKLDAERSNHRSSASNYSAN